MKQILAVAVAALLIAGAIVVRGAIDGDDGDGGSDGGNGTALVVACVTELAEACEALEGVVLRIQDPADTIAGAGDVDAWVTFDPWPEIAAFDDVSLPGTAVALAATEPVLLVRPAALGDCADWVCVTAASGSNAAALPPPSTALGLLAFGRAAAEWNELAGPGDTLTRSELELPEFEAWRRALRFVRDPVADMVQLRQAGPHAAGTTRAATEGRLGSQADELEAIAADATIAVVVAGRGADRIAADDGLRAGLEALGYRLDDGATTTGLPEAGVLYALKDLP